MKLSQLAQALNCRLEGDPDVEITGVSGMEKAEAGQLTFLANMKYAPKLKNTKASAVVAANPIPGLPTLVSSNPYLDFARALENFYQPPRPAPGIHPSAAIAATATLGANVSIGAFVSIGEHVTIGDGATLHPHSVVYEGASIGPGAILHSHAVVREFCQVGPA